MRGSKTVVSDTDSSATQSDSSATKTDSDMIDGEDEEVSAPSPDSCPFSEGEKVLAFHETQIYEAKVTKVDFKMNEWRFYVHYLGWSKKEVVRCLNGANQGEAEFLAEVSLIGKLYHMNLIEMWGYCVEGKHRLLVYEYMEHGSLAEKLSSNVLDWKQKFEIAVGTAKGLAYLHEECLEWVLHCDVKPQNILLDSNYNPKVADFGLSKVLNRGEQSNLSFSRIRGTRGYMAPEWVQNMRITSKVDVYSYGIVVLEMLTGKSPAESVQAIGGGEETHEKMMVTWVREKMNGAFANAESQKGDDYEQNRLEILVKVALQCLEEDKDARPTMSQVVEMLLHHENN